MQFTNSAAAAVSGFGTVKLYTQGCGGRMLLYIVGGGGGGGGFDGVWLEFGRGAN